MANVQYFKFKDLSIGERFYFSNNFYTKLNNLGVFYAFQNAEDDRGFKVHINLNFEVERVN
jgi:hypothetical protein